MLARSNEIESFGETKQTFFLSLLIFDIFNGRWASSATSHRTRQQNINVIFVLSFSVLVSFWLPLFSAQPHSSHCNEQIFFFIFPLTDFFSLSPVVRADLSISSYCLLSSVSFHFIFVAFFFFLFRLFIGICRFGQALAGCIIVDNSQLISERCLLSCVNALLHIRNDLKSKMIAMDEVPCVRRLRRWAGRVRAIFIAVELTPDGKNAEMTK